MINWTTTPNVTSTKVLTKKTGTWQDFIKSIRDTGQYPQKGTLPLLKMAEMGNTLNRKKSLRHEGNIQQVTGVIGDYDSEVLPVAQAIELLEKKGIKAYVYTSASHTPEKPRWRVVCPLSKPHSPDAHTALTARLNGALGGILAGESFTLAQFYYFGKVKGVAFEDALTFDDADEGGFIDTLDELDNLAIFKDGSRTPTATPTASGTTPAHHTGGHHAGRWSHAEFEAKVQELGRLLRSGDGRREMLKRAIASMSAKGVRDVETVGMAVRGIASQYFDPADPEDVSNISDLIEWATSRDNARAAEHARLAEPVLAAFKKKMADSQPQADSDGVTFVPDVDFGDEPVPGERAIGEPLAPAPKKKAGRPPKTDTEEKNKFVPLYRPATKDNPVLAALKEQGLHITQESARAHVVNCPFDDGTGEPHTATYFEPSVKFPWGGFTCTHEHVGKKKKTISDLLTWLDVETWQVEGKACIRIIPSKLAEVCDAMETVLGTDPTTYQQPGGDIVRVVTDSETGHTRMQVQNEAALTRQLSEASHFERYDKRSKEWEDDDAPKRHIETVLGTSAHKSLKTVRGLARQPHFRADGTLCDVPAYDTASQIYGAFQPGEFSVPSKPTRQDAEAALAKLMNLISGFRFVAERDRVVALAGMLTGAIRSSLPTAPLFHTRATQAGSGKTTLAKLQAAFCSPDAPQAATYSTDPIEAAKQILALLASGPSVINFDNLTSDMKDHPVMCSMLTEERIQGRILGFTKTVTCSTRVLVLATGNNVAPIGDLTRRSLVCDINPKTEHAFQIHYDFDPMEVMQKNRGDYVSAALTIIRAHHVAGKPHTACQPFGSFQEWSNMVRQPLLWLGLPDPTESVREAAEADPELSQLTELVHAWRECFGTVPALASTACDVAERGQLTLKEVLTDVCGERGGALNRKRLGWYLKRHAARHVQGFQFVGEPKRGSMAWALRPTNEKPAKASMPQSNPLLAEEVL